MLLGRTTRGAARRQAKAASQLGTSLVSPRRSFGKQRLREAPDDLDWLGDCVHVERPGVPLRRHHLRSTSGTGDAVCLTACMPSCLLTRDQRSVAEDLSSAAAGRALGSVVNLAGTNGMARLRRGSQMPPSCCACNAVDVTIVTGRATGRAPAELGSHEGPLFPSSCSCLAIEA